MKPNPWMRLSATLLASLAGLVLCFTCLQAVAAQAPEAGRSESAAASVWFVSTFPGEGLVAYWKFDQVFDSKTFNATPVTVHTILTGSSQITTSVPTTVSVPDFGALDLNGVNGAAVVTSSPGLDVAPAAFSLAAWVRRGSTGTYDAIYDSGTETNKWWVFIADSSKLDRFGFGVRGITETYSTRAITDTNWHHLAVVKNGNGPGNMTFYVDGAASGVVTVTNVLTPSGDKHIGVLLDGSLLANFGGSLDELRLYNRALSAAEVGLLAAGRGCVTAGTSWAAAFSDLQCAIQAASSGDQVWLASGTYHPGTAREASFHLLKDLGLLGGFNGTETSPAQRPAFDPLAPLTALSGDAAGDDLPDTFGNYDDNACNVVATGNSAIPLLFPISATFDGLAIEDGNARCSFPESSSGGGLTNFSAVHLDFNNVVFQANKATSAGGGLAGSGQMNLNAVRFSRNKAGQGGGLAMALGNVTMTAASFANNTAVVGGAIELQDPIIAHIGVIITGTSFSGNQASDSGGALYAQITNGAVDLTINQSTFTSNSNAGGKGGAIDNICPGAGVVRALVSHSTFTGNVAQEDGGAVSDFACQTTLAEDTFTGNSSPNGQGGALEARSLITVTNGTFQNNSALSTGGAAAVFGTLVMTGASLSHNQVLAANAASDFTPVGGGVYVSGTALITNSQFLSNIANVTSLLGNNLAGGGGLAVQGSLALSGGDFRGNSAEHGGGLFAQGTATVQNSLFQGNTAGSGGGVFADGILRFVSNRVVDNLALETLTNGSSQGGGLLLQNGTSSDVATNLFLDNHAATLDLGGTACGGSPACGGALSVDGFATSIANNTIVSHNPVTVSAVVITGFAGLFNNIITNHAAGIQVLGGTHFEDYNLFSGDTITATGVISAVGHSRVADPRFVAPAQDDYRLRLDSPAVDAGDNDNVKLFVIVDLNGGPRFVDIPGVPDTGHGTAPIVDIGAYEAANRNLFLPLIMR